MGSMLFNNIDDGYLEGLLRGFRGGILTSADYANLCQCETIDGAPPRGFPLSPLPGTHRHRAALLPASNDAAWPWAIGPPSPVRRPRSPLRPQRLRLQT